MPVQSVIGAKGQHRFPIALAARYRVLSGEKHSYVGTTFEISSAVVALKTSHSLPIGAKLVVDIDWPATLDGIALTLRMDGVVQHVERLQGHSYLLEIRMGRWEFRLSKRAVGAKRGVHDVAVVH